MPHYYNQERFNMEDQKIEQVVMMLKQIMEKLGIQPNDQTFETMSSEGQDKMIEQEFDKNKAQMMGENGSNGKM